MVFPVPRVGKFISDWYGNELKFFDEFYSLILPLILPPRPRFPSSLVFKFIHSFIHWFVHSFSHSYLAHSFLRLNPKKCVCLSLYSTNPSIWWKRLKESAKQQQRHHLVYMTFKSSLLFNPRLPHSSHFLSLLISLRRFWKVNNSLSKIQTWLFLCLF